MHYMIFPVGDWSGDGHSFNAEFLIQSEKPLNEVREVHFKENDFIGSLCEEYEDNKIEVFSFYSFLKKYISESDAQQTIKNLIDSQDCELTDDDFEFKELESRVKHTTNNYTVELSFEDNEENPQYLVIPDAQTMLNIWLLCLNAIDSTLKLECASDAMSAYFIKYKGYPHKPEGNINFYGQDSEKRQLNTPGYGVWTCDETEFYNGD